MVNTKNKKNATNLYKRADVVNDVDDGDQDSPINVAARLSRMKIGDAPEIHSFELMNLNPKLLAGIYSYGLEKPALIQQRAIVPGIKGHDIIMQAQSGMGKTAAMAIIILQKIQIDNKNCQALILTPTRELAIQVEGVISELGKRMEITTMVCVGGRGDLGRQSEEIRKKGVQIIVGTLGRIHHMLVMAETSVFNPLDIKMLVMDEADKMFEGSFKRPLAQLLEVVNGEAQVILMSATMPAKALKHAHEITYNPIAFSLSNEELTLEGIKQYYVNVSSEDTVKLVTLQELMPCIEEKHSLIFCETKKKVQDLYKKMIDLKYNVSYMSGLKFQSDREKSLQQFSSSKIRTLIASDLLGRGIDIQKVYVVINYDFPFKLEDYIHRVGRGGRYGRKGLAITFVTDQEMEKFKALQEFYHTAIPELPPLDELRKEMM